MRLVVSRTKTRLGSEEDENEVTGNEIESEETGNETEETGNETGSDVDSEDETGSNIVKKTWSTRKVASGSHKEPYDDGAKGEWTVIPYSP